MPLISNGIGAIVDVALAQRITVSPFSVVVDGAEVAGIVAAAVCAAESLALNSKRPCTLPEFTVIVYGPERQNE